MRTIFFFDFWHFELGSGVGDDCLLKLAALNCLVATLSKMPWGA
jgi:hypothetical protein